MTMPSTAHDLSRAIRSTTDVETLTNSFAQVQQLLEAGSLEPDDASDLRLQAFNTLVELTANDAPLGEDLIFEHLLKHCVYSSTDKTQPRMAAWHYRECLVGWIQQYSEREYLAIRERLLNQLKSYLLTDDRFRIEGSCWTIAHLGYRREDLKEPLWHVVQRYDGEAGDAALATLVQLGIPFSHQETILHELHQRTQHRSSIPAPLWGGLRRLANPESVEFISRLLLRRDDPDTSRRNVDLVIALLAAIADAHSEDPYIQTRVWSVLEQIFHSRADDAEPSVYLSSAVKSCNIALAVPKLLSQLIENTGEDDGSRHRRHLLHLRAQECIRPNQLVGWTRPMTPEVRHLLQQDACMDTARSGLFQTSESLLKDGAWTVSLCAGMHEALNWLDRAVSDEANPFTRRKVMEQLASFRIHPLPEQVLAWVTERYDRSESSKSDEWVVRLSAARMARSARSLPAFRALLNQGFTMGGELLQQTVDALADAAVDLAINGDASVIDMLVQKACERETSLQRRAATGAVERVAQFGLLSPDRGSQLFTAVTEHDYDDLERSMIIAALGFLPGDRVPPGLKEQFKEWASGTNNRLSWRALEALARYGDLVSESALLTEHLGLMEQDGHWDIVEEFSSDDWTSFIVALLYLAAPARFAPAVATILRTQEWRHALQVMGPLIDRHHTDGYTLPDSIHDALVERVHQRQGAWIAEVALFQTIGSIAPDILAQERWISEWTDWLPNARVAHADAMATATARLSDSAQALRVLGELTGDSHYAVRRSAFRALAALSADALLARCQGWSAADDRRLRQRAAEASAWLPETDDFLAAYAGLRRELEIDRERSVRESMERANRERRDRFWAAQYLSIVTEATTGGNEAILGAWRYGQAITHIGDDTCIRRLREQAASTIPAHARHWLELVIEDVDKRWTKVTREWPDPWRSWEGRVEERLGTISTASGASARVRCSLWLQPAASLSEKHDWGGEAWIQDSGDANAGFISSQPDDITLHLDDGREAKLAIKGTSTKATSSGSSYSLITFSGHGPYPF